MPPAFSWPPGPARAAAWAALACLAGCSRSAPTAPPNPPQQVSPARAANSEGERGHDAGSREGQAASPSPEPVSSEPVSSEPASSEPVSSEPVDLPELLPEASFPPADIVPPHVGTAASGDGRWRPFAPPEEGRDAPPPGKTESQLRPDELPPLLVTRLHPHPTSRFRTLTIAALDLRRLRLFHELGTSDLSGTQHAKLANEVGRVPVEWQPQLLAVFNGGFQPRHGWWGIVSHGVELVEPREGGCALVSFALPKRPSPSFRPVKLAPWSQLEGERESMVSIRQGPPCLIENGQLHARLQSGNERPWGGQQKDRKTRRRSAVALSADGRTLYYVLAEEMGVKELAQGLLHLEVEVAAQLDINWNWTRFWVVQSSAGATPRGEAREGRPAKVLAPLVENMAKDRGEYITRRSGRDFFYLTSAQTTP